MGIRAKLILSTCLPLLVIYVIVLSWDYWKSSQSALQQIEMLVAQRASADAAQVNGRLLAIQQTVNRAAYMLANRAGNMGPEGQRGGAPANEPGGRPSGGPPAEEGSGPPPGPPPEFSGTTGPFRNNRLTNAGYGGFLAAAIRQTSWVSSIWVHFETTVGRANKGDTYGVKRFAADRRPEDFKPDAAKVATVSQLALQRGHGTWIDPVELGELGEDKPFLFAEPFYSQDEGQALGVVCVTIAPDLLRFLHEDSPVQSELRRLMGTTPATRPTTDAAAEPRSVAHGGYLLLDRDGKVLSRPDGKLHGKPLATGPDKEELEQAIKQASAGKGQIVVAGGLDEVLGEMAPRSRYVLAMEPLSSTGWLYVTAAPESELLDPVQDRLIKRAGFLMVSLVILVVVVIGVLSRFCRPIEQMAVSVRQLASGDLETAPVPVTANDEIGQLAKGFNDMTGRLRQHVAELTTQTAEREKVESELRIARQIQSDLLPRTFPPFPDRDEFQLHAVNIPARYIAGDFFDFFFVDANTLTVVIADVSGKGVPAALMMAVTRTMVRNLAAAGLSPHQIVERINRMLVEDTTPGLFVTMILGQYEPSTGRFIYVNAGHPAAIHINTAGQATTCCGPTGPLLGVDASGAMGPYLQQTITLEPGEAVLLYTDGVTEAHDEAHKLYGEPRLIKSASAPGRSVPSTLCGGVVDDVMAYQHGLAADDLTLVALQRTAGQVGS